MHEFDRFDETVKRRAAAEPMEVPEAVKVRIEQTLAGLPERAVETAAPSEIQVGMKKTRNRRVRRTPGLAQMAACLLFVAFVLMPNISVSYAQALEKVPVIGSIVKVVTLRNYFYEDDHHQMDIDVPQIEDDEDGGAADLINKDVKELTAALVDQFYKDLEVTGGEGYGSVTADYETVTDTDRWFTLKVSVLETAASSDSYFRYYHIDKASGRIVKLGDLFNTDRFSDVLAREIRKQMQARMDADENAVYWINDGDIGKDFASVGPDHNFYWNEDGDLVIPFDKYEVAPGSMGTPEFAIGKDVIKGILKEEFHL